MFLDRTILNLKTEEVACALLGQYLCHETEDGFVSGIIVEAEAYLSCNDSACHASRGMTGRNATMFGSPGQAYVYFIYGNYYCLNVVTGPKDTGEAVLIRAVEPFSGLDLMRRRRGRASKTTDLASGPGKLCQAFAIDKALDGHDLRKKPLYIDKNSNGEALTIISTPRIGISSAKDKKLRFIISGSKYLSRRETLG